VKDAVAGAKEANMLKITITETATERKWILAGRLVGPWVGELRTTWKRMVPTHAGRVCTIDLDEVTFIDRGGERLLRALSRKGVRLMANGLYTKHVLDTLKVTSKTSVRNLLIWVVAGFLAHATMAGIWGMTTKAEDTRTHEAVSVRANSSGHSALNKEDFPGVEGRIAWPRT
jgi:hypothetical protein